jgi:broad specificity phosphatase PhoE
MTREEIDLKFGAAMLEAWGNVGPDSWDIRLPGGETKREHVTRVLEGLNDFLSKTDHQRVGVATHGGTIRRLVHHFAPELKDPAMIGNCAVYRFEYSKEKGLTLPLHAPLWTCMLT